MSGNTQKPRDTRAAEALAADRAQSLSVGQREQAFHFTVAILAIAEIALWYFEASSWAMVTAAIIWLGFLFHNTMTIVLHELAELNDQLAGRKDEFRTLLTRSGYGRPER